MLYRTILMAMAVVVATWLAAAWIYFSMQALRTTDQLIDQEGKNQ